MGEGKSAMQFLASVSSEASSRISSRILEDERYISFPVGGEKGLLGPILSFMPTAKEGFNLSLRSEDVKKGEIKDLLRITVMGDLEPQSEVHIIKNDPSLSVFRHTLITILSLSRVGVVDQIPGISHWPHRPSKEDVWVLMNEIEDATEQLIWDREVSVSEEAALRAAHFFSEGSKIANSLGFLKLF